jgi:response regulator RpfG family c-di-GMP phosphodiesterase
MYVFLKKINCDVVETEIIFGSGVGLTGTSVLGERILSFRQAIYDQNIQISVIERAQQEQEKALSRKINREEFLHMPEAEFKTTFFGFLKKDIEPLMYARQKEEDPYFAEIRKIADVSPGEQAKKMKDLHDQLLELDKFSDSVDQKVLRIIAILNESLIINNAALRFKLAADDDESHAQLLDMQKTTKGIIRKIFNTIQRSELSIKFFSRLQDLSNGQTINHMTNVFLLVNNFIHYFNFIMKSSSLPIAINKIFPEHYLETYARRLPQLNKRDITIHTVLPINVLLPNDIMMILLGAYLHDGGKIEDLPYFESGNARDLERIQKHVFIGYALIMQAWGDNYKQVAQIAGLHHEYDNHPDGYGIHRIENRSQDRIYRAMSYDYIEYEQGSSLSYLPAQIVSLADVYEALGDKRRKYRDAKVMTPAEVLVFMHEKFVLTQKFDPLLFDIFVDSLAWQKIETPSQLGLQHKLVS